MAPTKTPDANVPTYEKSLIWTSKMDDALIDAFMHELDMGHNVNGTFTTTAYDNIIAYLTMLFGFKVDKDKVKNRWKTLKKKYSEIYDFFKGGMSGFSWNSSTHTWEAEDQVWEQLIEVKPKAAHWRNTPLPNYEKMLALYENDRATGDDGDTPSNMKKMRISIPPPTHSSPPSPVENEVDPLLTQNNMIFQDFLVNLDDVEVDDPSHGAQRRLKGLVQTTQKTLLLKEC
ncbi:hypothetical protein K1719_018282 [Acacia pycnantha]|nr:hypothetical protein K1719_018282 [Acacia pycnantha]